MSCRVAAFHSICWLLSSYSLPVQAWVRERYRDLSLALWHAGLAGCLRGHWIAQLNCCSYTCCKTSHVQMDKGLGLAHIYGSGQAKPSYPCLTLQSAPLSLSLLAQPKVQAATTMRSFATMIMYDGEDAWRATSSSEYVKSYTLL